MGLEERKGNLYYYEKERIGNRVVSKYVGGGAFALLAEQFAKERAEEKAAERKIINKQEEEIAKLDAEIDCLTEWIETLSASDLITSGYHQHKGEWRKRHH